MEHFYRRLIGLELLQREHDRIWLAIDERTRLGLWSPGSKEFGDRGGRHVHFAFSLTPGALDRLTQRLRDDQIEVRGPVEHPGEIARSTFRIRPATSSKRGISSSGEKVPARG